MTRLPESALHRIWERHSVLLPRLRTRDGRAVRIIRAGTPNPDSGPDFLGAVLRIGATTFRGDVEIHTTSTGWHHHHHHTDPRYNRVILHVVAEDPDTSPAACTASGRRLPVLILPAIVPHTAVHASDRDRIVTSCVTRLQSNGDPRAMLARLGRARLRRKARRFEHRLRQLVAEEHGIVAEPEPSYATRERIGPHPAYAWPLRTLREPHLWEQLAYEGMMESMGYARNSAAFLLLSRTITLRMLRGRGLTDVDGVMGMLFGAAGLLPAPETLDDPDAAVCVRRLRRHWHTAAASLDHSRLTGADWVFFRLRPANFPTARIAAVAYLLPVLFADRRLCAIMRDAVYGVGPVRARLRRLQCACAIAPEGYWSHHLHFRDRWKDRGIRLGRDRIAIIMMNALVPAALAYARVTHDRRLARKVYALARDIPPPHEPAIIREIRAHGLNKEMKLTAMEEMGLLELRSREERRWT
ncbi:MAG: DUF2851 family protein [Ignavibacteriae bacterium]|nr:DUF2851 family protein [Ignavibacteriota bacterium]